MRGWIVDCYADPAQDAMVTWLRTNSGVERLEDRRFRPAFYVWAPRDRLGELKTSIQMLGTAEVSEERRRIWLGEREREVLRVVPSTYDQLTPLARTVDRWGLYRDYKLFNVDFRMEHRYFMAHDIFPMGLLEYDGRFHHLDTPYRLDYALPDLRVCRLDLKVEARQRIPTMEDRSALRTPRRHGAGGRRGGGAGGPGPHPAPDGPGRGRDRRRRRVLPGLPAGPGGAARRPGGAGPGPGHAPGQGQELLHLRPHRLQGPGAQAARTHPHRLRPARSCSTSPGCMASSTCPGCPASRCRRCPACRQAPPSAPCR